MVEFDSGKVIGASQSSGVLPHSRRMQGAYCITGGKEAAFKLDGTECPGEWREKVMAKRRELSFMVCPTMILKTMLLIVSENEKAITITSAKGNKTNDGVGQGTTSEGQQKNNIFAILCAVNRRLLLIL